MKQKIRTQFYTVMFFFKKKKKDYYVSRWKYCFKQTHKSHVQDAQKQGEDKKSLEAKKDIQEVGKEV